jgi:hypothetical protein
MVVGRQCLLFVDGAKSSVGKHGYIIFDNAVSHGNGALFHGIHMDLFHGIHVDLSMEFKVDMPKFHMEPVESMCNPYGINHSMSIP